mgnify:CR=1 FL=1
MNLEPALAWWLAPMSGAATHELPTWAVWHARLMVLAWAVLLPLGVLAARYFKVTPKQDWPRAVDNRAWWNAHRGLQYAGVVVMLIGAALAWGNGVSGSAAATAHAWLGWLLVGLGAFQIVGAWLRGSKGGPTEPEPSGDHYDMTPHRRYFERLHKGGGWLALGLAVVTLGLGLVVADAPRWMPLVLGTWWLALATLAMRWQRAGRCIDTYQAIWGPSLVHPGNQVRPTGWGIRRHPDGRERSLS